MVLLFLQKQKTAAYYKTRHSELDSKLLHVVPECPRSAKESFAANFDWSLLSPQGGHVNGIRNAEKMLGTAIANHLDNIHHVDHKGDNGNEEGSNEETKNNQGNRSATFYISYIYDSCVCFAGLYMPAF